MDSGREGGRAWEENAAAEGVEGSSGEHSGGWKRERRSVEREFLVGEWWRAE